MNKVLVTGNLVKDVDLRYTPDGNNAVTSNCIAVKRDRKNENGEYEADFINFVAWTNQAQYLKDYARKGDHLEIVGHWQVRKYEDKNGDLKTINELIVENIALHSSKKEEKPEEKTTYDDARKILKNEIDNDLPF